MDLMRTNKPKQDSLSRATFRMFEPSGYDLLGD